MTTGTQGSHSRFTPALAKAAESGISPGSIFLAQSGQNAFQDQDEGPTMSWWISRSQEMVALAVNVKNCLF